MIECVSHALIDLTSSNFHKLMKREQRSLLAEIACLISSSFWRELFSIRNFLQ